MVTSDLRTEVEMWLFRACAMHPAMNSSFIVDLAMGQISQNVFPVVDELLNSIEICGCLHHIADSEKSRSAKQIYIVQ